MNDIAWVEGRNHSHKRSNGLVPRTPNQQHRRSCCPALTYWSPVLPALGAKRFLLAPKTQDASPSAKTHRLEPSIPTRLCSLSLPIFKEIHKDADLQLWS